MGNTVPFGQGHSKLSPVLWQFDIAAELLCFLLCLLSLSVDSVDRARLISVNLFMRALSE
jgi:hypothetical protein